jgi:type I restriction-modification system DNA methylase subunit
MGVRVTEMEESNNTKKLVSDLWEAFEMLNRSTSTVGNEVFKAIFALFAYKRFSDTNIIEMPKDCGWDQLVNYPIDQFFVQLENNFYQLQTANELPDIARVLNLKQFNDQLPNNIKEDLINIFDGMGLSHEKCSTDQVNEIVSDFFQGYFSKYPLSIFENKSLNRLAVKLLDPRGHVYFPYCGIGDIMMQASNYYDAEYTMEPIDFEWQSTEARISIQGSIPNSDIWAAAVLRFLLADMPWIDVNNNEDYFIDPKRNLADVIFYSNPLDINLPSDIESTICVEDSTFDISHNQSELFVLLQSLKHLNFGGRLGIVLPSNVLYKVTDNHKKVRKYLVENDYLEAIVQLPAGVFPQSNLKLVLMIINTTKPEKKAGKFAFMTVEATKQEGISVITNDAINKAIYIYNNLSSSSNNYISTLKDIQQQNYNLLPSRYMRSIAAEQQKMLKLKTGSQLGAISRIICGTSKGVLGNVNGVPVITVKNLSKDVEELYLSLEDISPALPADLNQSIKEKCIVVSLVGNELKPTIFDPEVFKKMDMSPEILLDEDLAAIFPNNGIVDFDFLYYKLDDIVVKTQVEEAHAVAGSSYIGPLQLKQIVVPMRDGIEVQQSFAKNQKTELLKAAAAKYEALREKLQIKQEAESSIVQHLAHSIRPKLHIAKSPILSLVAFLKDKHLIEETLSTKLDGNKESVGEALDQALKSIDQISDVLAHTRKLVMNKISRNDFKDINIYSVFEDDIKPLYSAKRFKIVDTCKGNCVLSLHKESFVEAINSLLVNAEVHAFNQGHKGNPELRFYFHGTKDNVLIDYTNNGLRFPADMTEEQFQTYGEKSVASAGEGLGGAWFGKFLKAHMGTFTIVRDKHPLHFQIVLPRRHE